LAQGGISLGQGVVIILAGAGADHYSPAWVIAVAGTVGAVVAMAIAVNWARDRGRTSNGHLQFLRFSPRWCRAWRAPSGGAADRAGLEGVSPRWCRAWRVPSGGAAGRAGWEGVSPRSCRARRAPPFK
jgi:hypothetical protein